MKYYRLSLCWIILLVSCTGKQQTEMSQENALTDESKVITLSRDDYLDQLYGFWLGQCIANWTGLVTEMDKIGNIGEIRTGDFYTRADWSKPDQPSIWGAGIPSNLSPTIDFILMDTSQIWGADDDTDIEYIYQELLYTHETCLLTPRQIREGWLRHIKAEEENYLWVSNQKAFDLMQTGMLPPETGNPANNEHFEMIDAQLTTEIFGLFAPGRPDIARKMALLPIQTTARNEAEEIAMFYVNMYALASLYTEKTLSERIYLMANESRAKLTNDQYPAKMYDYIFKLHQSGIPWEQTRDSLYVRYQVHQQDGYDLTEQNLYCNGCFAAGINFAASLVSLFYGEGDLKETIKIGTLAGWDSDNPTATWGGMIGFMIGKAGIEKTFDRKFSNRFNIHRTRQHFPNDGIDTFEEMALKGLAVTDRVVTEMIGGSLDATSNTWTIPLSRKTD